MNQIAFRSCYAVVAAAVAVVVVIWASTLILLERSRADAINQAFGQAESRAAIAAESVLRVFELAKSLQDLVAMRRAMLQTGNEAGAQAIAEHLRAVAAEGRFGVVQVADIGVDGVLSWGSAIGTVGVNLADRDHFRIHADGIERGLAVSRPLIGRTTNRWSLQVTRPLEAEDGRFDGVAVVSLDPVTLSESLQAELGGAGRLVVARRLSDGSLLLRGRDPAESLGRIASPGHPTVLAARTAATGHLRFPSELDGRRVLAGYTVPHGLPIVVSAVFDEAEELRAWTEQRTVFLLAALGLSVLVAVLLMLWFALRRSRLQQQRLSDQRIEAAEALARQRAEILAIVAHEIRTPLTSVLGFGELLVKAQLSPEHHRHAGIVVETGRVLLTVLNDILDLARLEAGKVSLELQSFATADLLRQCRDLCHSVACEKGLSITLEMAPDLPCWLLGDSPRIRQVIGNLLSNAVKFTERGGVTLRARATAGCDKDDVLLCFEVEDTGIGIVAEDQARLFEMFQQAPDGRRYGGTGLGLAICRRLIEAMGGSIGVESAVGRGTTFRFELPLRSTDAPQPSAAPQIGVLSPLDILVVDDVATNRMLLTIHLSGGGHRIVQAEDGVEAVAVAQERRFDVILMDVNMPVMDGLEATRRLRAGGGPNAATPIIALTAGASAKEQQKVLQAGMTLHLSKPVNFPALLEALRKIVEAPRPVAVES